ncbi:MAG: MBOAT family protein [Sedimentisphaerales bacterium]|nr:MBOAT family protein [Sedimentisphaerales bacterium]
MLFNSFEFLFFFIIVVTLYFLLPDRFRWILLLGSSYYFYMCWKAEYLVLILVSTLIAYGTGILMGRTDNNVSRKIYLCISLCSNLGILFFFKYANFFGANIQFFLDQFDVSATIPHLNILLPVGISFYTFQVLSYTIDVYRRKTLPEKHLGLFAVYVAFFPQLVAGPIERSHRLLPQFREQKRFEYSNIRQGAELAMWGLFKKMVVADLISIVVDSVYGSPQSYSGMILILATFFFTIQIYCDFSGYSDIAIGIAKILGYDLMINFRQPYFSRTISEFWQRWHISLSTWFRDYLYIPLGGSRVSKRRWYCNILVVFAVSGLWHGANWTFVVWGLLHGVYLLLGSATQSWRKRLSGILRLDQIPRLHEVWKILFVFVLVAVGWIFFRARSLSDAFYIVGHLFDFGGFRVADLWTLGLPRFEMMVALGSIGVLFCVDCIASEGLLSKEYVRESTVLRYICYAVCFYAIVFFGVFDKIEFVYFQF